MATRTAKLLRLKDTDLKLADPAEDIRGRKVLDPAGDEVGTVDELFIDATEKKVRLLQVHTGGFLGLGETKFMLPVDAITRVTDDAVCIDQTRERVAGAPRYDPDFVREPDWEPLYGYYGYPVYWGPDYTYPPFPFYR